MAIDWAAVSASVAEIRPKVRATLDFVTEEAVAANEKIGTEITEYVAGSVPDALAILADVTVEIENKTLNEEKAKAFMDKLKMHLGKVREHLKPNVAQLPGPVADKIRARLEESMAEVAKINQHVYQLLLK